jgi:putative polysaccharide biosynthesis protein
MRIAASPQTVMRIADCAPSIVLARDHTDDESPAALIHRSYARMLRQRYQSWALPLLQVAAIGAWVPYVVGGMLRTTWLNGGTVHARIGKSVLRQLTEQIRLALVDGIPPRWYYTFELFDDGHRRRSAEYLQRGETKRGAYAMLKDTGARTMSPLTDKVAFAARCVRHGLRAIPILLWLDDGRFTFADGHAALPKQDLFVKPNHGKGGRGAEWWRYRPSGDYEGTAGNTLTEAQLLLHLRALPFKEGVVVQPRRTNHPALVDLSNDALATVRIVTCRNEHGAFEATNAVLRMAHGANHVVDNFHAGGLAAKVDLATGTLGLATDLGIRPHVGWRVTHPNSEARIAGRVLPYWAETLALALRAHAIFADRIVIGWDIAITAEGPELVEGNGSPDLDIIQRTHEEPLGNARLGQLLAFHLTRSESWPAAIRAEIRTPAEH